MVIHCYYEGSEAADGGGVVEALVYIGFFIVGAIAGACFMITVHRENHPDCHGIRRDDDDTR